MIGTSELKVLLVSSIFPPDIGGPATFIPKFAEYLCRIGCAVTVVTLSDSKSGEFFEAGYKVIYIKRSRIRSIRMLNTLLILIKALRRNDLLLCNGLFLETALAIKFSPIRSVAKVVGDLAWERYKNRGGQLSIEEFNRRNLGTFSRLVFSWSLSQFEAIYTPGDALSKIVNSWKLKSKVSVIENGVECSSNLPKKGVSQYDVVTVTRLVPWKNVDLLIRACKIAECRLVVVGDGPELENLRNLAYALEVDCSFMGQVSQEVVRNVLRDSEIFILVSNYEGQSFALTEAMMVGKPILVSEIPGNLAVIQNNVTGLTTQIEVREIASKILSLVADEGLKMRLGANARSRAQEKYCQDRQFQKVFTLIRENS